VGLEPSAAWSTALSSSRGLVLELHAVQFCRREPLNTTHTFCEALCTSSVFHRM
jgi:hypothetical protein